MKLQNKDIVVIGDIHGRDVWKKIVNDPQNKDKTIIFIGDYFDSFTIPRPDQLNNYFDIMQYKEDNPDRVYCILGNHDIMYLSYLHDTCSGFCPVFKSIVQYPLDRNVKDGLHTMAVQAENGGIKFLFTHAGVSGIWASNNNIDIDDPVEDINELFLNKPGKFNFTSGDTLDFYGNSSTQPPTWIRPKKLNKVRIKNFIHIVGHTWHKKIVNKHYKNIIICDSLPNQYLVISKDGTLTPVNI